MAYLTNADVAAYLGETLTAPQQAQVDALIPAVEAAANAYANRKWGVSAQQTETFDGGQQVYFPSNSPITAVASVAVDGAALQASEYFVYSSYVTLDSPANTGRRNVVIAYTANNPLPSDVKQALIQWVAQLFKADKGSTAGVKRAQFGPGEVEYFQPQDGASKLPTHVETVLDRYRLSPV